MGVQLPPRARATGPGSRIRGFVLSGQRSAAGGSECLRPGCVDHLGDTGAVWGALFGVIAHAMTKGERDFSSVMSLRASRYDVSVDADHVAEAERYRAP